MFWFLGPTDNHRCLELSSAEAVASGENVIVASSYKLSLVLVSLIIYLADGFFLIYLWQEVAGFPFRVTVLLSVTDVSGSVLLDSFILSSMFRCFLCIKLSHACTYRLPSWEKSYMFMTFMYSIFAVTVFFLSFFHFFIFILAEYTVGHKQK